MMANIEKITITIKKCPLSEGGYTASVKGLPGAVIGAGDTFDETLADITSAIRFHIETLGGR